MAKFTKALQGRAWERLQAEIKESGQRTPGEYDLPSCVDHVAQTMRAEFGLDYSRIADYLAARYDCDTETED